MRKRPTRVEVPVERAKSSATKKARPRSWKEYFDTAPRLSDDFPKRLRDCRPEKVDRI